LGRLIKNARSLLGLVEELLDCAELEEGTSRLSMKQIAVEPLLDQLRSNLAPLEQEKPFKVQYEIKGHIPRFAPTGKNLEAYSATFLATRLNLPTTAKSS
jgi:signal transduction histidine kinase